MTSGKKYFLGDFDSRFSVSCCSRDPGVSPTGESESVRIFDVDTHRTAGIPFAPKTVRGKCRWPCVATPLAYQ